MYKWHVHSAIGRGRPVANDIARVADGIAASLRQFSISVSRSADGDSQPLSRSQRSAEALKEVSSLAPAPSRGIDARSLAAKPPSNFKIRRIDDPSTRRNRGSGNYVSRGGTRGNFRGPMRGGAGARGGIRAGGRGDRGGPSRGRGRRGAGTNKLRAPKPKGDEEELTWDPYTKEEAEAITEIKGGYSAPWKPTTSIESLAAWMPAVASSPSGLIHTAEWKIASATNGHPDFRMGGDHLREVRGGVGSLFESMEERKKLETLSGPLAKELGDSLGFYPGKLGSLSKADKDALSKQWIAGQYDKPQPAEKGNILAQVGVYARRNETYLREDSRKLEESIRSRLPVQNLKLKPNMGKPL